MISFLFASAGLLNLLFYIFAIGAAVAFVLEQLPTVKENKENLLYRAIENIVSDKHG